MRKYISAGPVTLAALLLGSALMIGACVPAPMDAEPTNVARTGGSSGSSGGSSGSSSGGSSGSSSGGSTGSSGGSSGSAKGGSSGGDGGSTGSSGGSSGSAKGGSSGSTGGASGGGKGGSTGSTGGSSGGTPDGGGMAGGDAVTFTMVYEGVIMKSCLPCHGTNPAQHKMMDFKDKAAALASLKGAAGMIKAGDAMGSKLITQITSQGGKPPAMPKGKPALSMGDVDKVKAWITAGAKDD